MKVKLKFDQAALQQWCLNHGEKLGFSLFLLFTILVVWGAVGQQPYKNAPKDLQNEIASLKSKVDSVTWDPEAEGVALPKPPFAEQIAVASKPVDPKLFTWAALFNPPLFEHKDRRGEPNYLPLVDLRAEFDQGAVELHEAKNYYGHHWVVLTGLLPYEAQVMEYERQFRNSIYVRPVGDTPEYLDMVVERAEIDPTAPDAPPKWTELKLQENFELWSGFAAQGPQVLPPAQELVLDGTTHRVPPLLGRDPDARYAHEPELPFVLQQREAAKADPAATPAPGTPAPGKGAVRPGRGNPEAAAAAAKASEEAQKQAAAQAQQQQKPPQYKLFRFCDFSVERLKTYRYRAKLFLKNPNAGVAPQYLKDYKYAQGADRQTDWSPVSNPVSLPRDYELTVVDIRPGVSGIETFARIAIRKFEPTFGGFVDQVFGDFADKTPTSNRSYERGTLLNFDNVEGQYKTPVGEPKAGRVNFITNSMLAGIAGGDRPPASGTPGSGPSFGNLRAPAEIVVVGPDGRLSIHSQLQELGIAKTASTAAPAKQPGATPKPGETPTGDKPKPNPFGDILKLPGKK